MKKYRLKNFSTFFIIFFVVLFTVTFSFGNEYNLNENEAKKIITEHIKNCYYTITVGDITIKNVGSNQKRIKSVEDYLKKFESLGLINYNERFDGLYNYYSIQLSEKAKNANPVNCDKEGKSVGFLAGNREVSEIIKIDKNDNMVFFSYIFIPNEIAKAFEDIGKKRYRGKVKITYDLFLKRYVFQGFMYSPWENEKWENATWHYVEDGKTICTREIK